MKKEGQDLERTLYETVSAIYVWVYSETFSEKEVSELMNDTKSGKLTPKGGEVWWNQSKWHYGDDVMPSLESFLFEKLPKLEGIKKLLEDDNTSVEVDWVIGIGDDVNYGTYPILRLSPKIIAELNKWKFNFEIHLDDQISAVQIGLKEPE